MHDRFLYLCLVYICKWAEALCHVGLSILQRNEATNPPFKHNGSATICATAMPSNAYVYRTCMHGQWAMHAPYIRHNTESNTNPHIFICIMHMFTGLVCSAMTPSQSDAPLPLARERCSRVFIIYSWQLQLPVCLKSTPICRRKSVFIIYRLFPVFCSNICLYPLGDATASAWSDARMRRTYLRPLSSRKSSARDDVMKLAAADAAHY